jgi:hypothetical protein
LECRRTCAANTKVNPQKAVTFHDDVEDAGLKPEMLLVAIGWPFARSARHDERRHARARPAAKTDAVAAKRLACTPMRRWAQKHLEL